jgi:glycosyltransferase involved in cell wall biosynthesis
MKPAIVSVAIQAAGSAATVGAALLVASTMGLAAQGQFALMRSWNDALVALAVLGLPQALLHLQYREGVPVAALRPWVTRYLLGLAAISLAFGAGLLALPAGRVLGAPAATPFAVLALAVPAAAAHMLWRSLALRDVGVLTYAVMTALPALLIVVLLVPVSLMRQVSGFGWVLVASASVSACVSGALVVRLAQRQTEADSRQAWSRRTLWSVGVETAAQSVLAALTPALLLSTIGWFGAPLAEVGAVSLGVHVYQLFGVAAAYAAPMVYDRAARSESAVRTDALLAGLRARFGVAHGRLAAVFALLTLALVRWLWPAGADSIVLLSLMAIAGLLSMGVRVLVTLMLARGAFRPLTVQALVRVLVVLGAAALLIQRWPATVAVPIALVGTELLMLGWLLRYLRGNEPADPRTEGHGADNPALVLITTNYPYTHTGGEVMFVAPEMPHLVREFSSVRVVPQHTGGERLEVPAGVVVDTSLALALRSERLVSPLRALAWRGVAGELWRGFRRGGWVGAVRVWRWAAIAQLTYRWARRSVDDTTPVLFYTYWRGGSTLALARLARERRATQAVTRVHRYELYEDCFDPPFQPWHPALYHELTLTVTVSKDGMDYLERAGVPADRLALSRLGTGAPAGLARASMDGAVRIVSCSFVTPVKRVPLIAQVLVAWAQRDGGRTIHWTHYGGGPELGRVKAALKDAPANLHAHLPGQVDNAAVLAHYASEAVDAFMLLSASEGLPVSVQEAASAGIPVLATDVGGVRELVGDDAGALLPADPTVAEVIAALDRVLGPGASVPQAALRETSRRRWSEGFDAENNHMQFARRLHAITSRATGHE